MRKLILFIFLLLSAWAYPQSSDLLYVEGLAYKVHTTAELNAISTKVEGDSYYDSDKKNVVVWDGTQWKSGSGGSGGTGHIDGNSPIGSFDFALGTWDQLNSVSFDVNTVLIPTDAESGDFVTTDSYATGLSFGLIGNDLTLTATRNGLSNLISNTISLPGGGGASDWGDLGGDIDNQTDLIGRLDAKSNLSTSNTFSGLNNFTGTVVFEKATDPFIQVRDGTNVGSSAVPRISFEDANNTVIGTVGFSSGGVMGLYNGSSNALLLGSASTTITGLSGTGTQMIVADASGALSRMNIPDGGGVSGPAVWGDITGTLSNQGDLQIALNAKSNTSHTHTTSNITNFNASGDARWLGKSSKAADSELLDGINSTSFLRSDASDQKTSGELTFNNNIELRLGSSNVSHLFSNGTNSYWDLVSGDLVIRNGSTNIMTLARTTGNLEVSGIMEADAFYEGSDIRLKQNIKSISPSFYSFEFKTRPGLTRYGVIAQELEISHPELILHDKDGMLSVNYIDMLVMRMAELENNNRKLTELVMQLMEKQDR